MKPVLFKINVMDSAGDIFNETIVKEFELQFFVKIRVPQRQEYLSLQFVDHLRLAFQFLIHQSNLV